MPQIDYFTWKIQNIPMLYTRKVADCSVMIKKGGLSADKMKGNVSPSILVTELWRFAESTSQGM